MGMSVEEYKKLISNEFKQKDPLRQLKGRMSHDIGKNFEEEIETICSVYDTNKLARIEKTPEPMKILKHLDLGRFEACFLKSAQPDFKGTIKGGRTVVFDAKFTTSNRITYQVLSDFQRETLLKYQDLGAISFVLVGFTNGGIYKIDINSWANMKEKFGRLYIKQEEMDVFRVNKNKSGISDFLEIM